MFIDRCPTVWLLSLPESKQSLSKVTVDNGATTKANIPKK